ncbi:CCHamide-like precursor, partial [Daphnia pulex]
MHIFFYVIHVTAMLAIVSGNCNKYGNACFGAHGKRSDFKRTSAVDLSDQIWPVAANWNPTRPDEPIQERRQMKPLPALQLESVLVYNDIPRSAEHSRYLNQEDYNN